MLQRFYILVQKYVVSMCALIRHERKKKSKK